MSSVDGQEFAERARILIIAQLALVGPTSQAALAHSGHAHQTGGGRAPLAIGILLGCALVAAISAYLGRTGHLPGPYSRAGVILGVLGIAVGLVLAV